MYGLGFIIVLVITLCLVVFVKPSSAAGSGTDEIVGVVGPTVDRWINFSPDSSLGGSSVRFTTWPEVMTELAKATGTTAILFVSKVSVTIPVGAFDLPKVTFICFKPTTVYLDEGVTFSGIVRITGPFTMVCRNQTQSILTIKPDTIPAAHHLVIDQYAGITGEGNKAPFLTIDEASATIVLTTYGGIFKYANQTDTLVRLINGAYVNLTADTASLDTTMIAKGDTSELDMSITNPKALLCNNYETESVGFGPQCFWEKS